MSSRWGRETAGQFFSRGCPLLLGLGAIAYWSLPAAGQAPTLRREIEGITQCVLVVGDGRLRIAKAEGRPPGVEGSVFRYASRKGCPCSQQRPRRRGSARHSRVSGSRVTSARRISPVSPASRRAPSPRPSAAARPLARDAARPGGEAEHHPRRAAARGRRPRIPARPARRSAPRRDATGRCRCSTIPARVFACISSASRRAAAATPDFAHKGVELVTVATGLVQVLLASGGPVLRQGEALIADRSGVTGWRNLSDREAIVFWVLHDDPALGLTPADGASAERARLAPGVRRVRDRVQVAGREALEAERVEQASSARRGAPSRPRGRRRSSCSRGSSRGSRRRSASGSRRPGSCRP